MEVDDNGYPRGNHSNLIHRQIAYREIYCKNRDKYPLRFRDYQVHHKDGNKRNFSIGNLQLVTKEEHEGIHGIVSSDNQHKGNDSSYEGYDEETFSLLKFMMKWIVPIIGLFLVYCNLKYDWDLFGEYELGIYFICLAWLGIVFFLKLRNIGNSRKRHIAYSLLFLITIALVFIYLIFAHIRVTALQEVALEKHCSEELERCKNSYNKVLPNMNAQEIWVISLRNSWKPYPMFPTSNQTKEVIFNVGFRTGCICAIKFTMSDNFYIINNNNANMNPEAVLVKKEMYYNGSLISSN